jgi:hypothetical protein
MFDNDTMFFLAGVDFFILNAAETNGLTCLPKYGGA